MKVQSESTFRNYIPPQSLEYLKDRTARLFGKEVAKNVPFTEQASASAEDITTIRLCAHVYSEETMAEVFEILKLHKDAITQDPHLMRLLTLLKK